MLSIAFFFFWPMGVYQWRRLLPSSCHMQMTVHTPVHALRRLPVVVVLFVEPLFGTLYPHFYSSILYLVYVTSNCHFAPHWLLGWQETSPFVHFFSCPYITIGLTSSNGSEFVASHEQPHDGSRRLVHRRTTCSVSRGSDIRPNRHLNFSAVSVGTVEIFPKTIPSREYPNDDSIKNMLLSR